MACQASAGATTANLKGGLGSALTRLANGITVAALAVMSHDGCARALWPAHTPIDGDIIFALATGRVPFGQDQGAMIELGAAAAACMTRAIARAVYEATAAHGDRLPTWRARFGS